MHRDEIIDIVIELRKQKLSYKHIATIVGFPNGKSGIDMVYKILSRFDLTDKPERIPVDYIEGEIWKPIADFPSYNISNLGRVSRNGFIVKGQINMRGYKTVSLSGHSKEVHRLVYKTFIKPDLSSDEVIHHIDNNRANPRLDNLELTNTQGNIDHCVKSKRNLNHVPDEIVMYILEQLEKKRHDLKNICNEVEVKFGRKISPHYIWKTRNTKARYYLQKNYNIPKPIPYKSVPDEKIEKLCKHMSEAKVWCSPTELLNKFEITQHIKLKPYEYLHKLFNGRRKDITSKYNIINWKNINPTTIPQAGKPQQE